jgi:hypothetical protein
MSPQSIVLGAFLVSRPWSVVRCQRHKAQCAAMSRAAENKAQGLPIVYFSSISTCSMSYALCFLGNGLRTTDNGQQLMLFS